MGNKIAWHHAGFFQLRQLIRTQGLGMYHDRTGICGFLSAVMIAVQHLLACGISVAVYQQLAVFIKSLLYVAVHLLIRIDRIAAIITAVFIRLAHPCRLPLWGAVQKQLVAADAKVVPPPWIAQLRC